jgi:hypothetical protein
LVSPADPFLFSLEADPSVSLEVGQFLFPPEDRLQSLTLLLFSQADPFLFSPEEDQFLFSLADRLASPADPFLFSLEEDRLASPAGPLILLADPLLDFLQLLPA